MAQRLPIAPIESRAGGQRAPNFRLGKVTNSFLVLRLSWIFCIAAGLGWIFVFILRLFLMQGCILVHHSMASLCIFRYHYNYVESQVSSNCDPSFIVEIRLMHCDVNYIHWRRLQTSPILRISYLMGVSFSILPWGKKQFCQ